MESDELMASVKDLVARTLQIPLDELTVDSKLGDYELDSLDIIRLSLVCEKTYQIALSPSDFGRAQTFGDVIDVLKQKITSGSTISSEK
jgi:acyl carrier protein